MSNLIEVKQENTPPILICPHCKEQILIDITVFRENIVKIFRDNCPKCGGENFVGLMIIGHKDLKKLLATIQHIVDAVNSQNTFRG